MPSFILQMYFGPIFQKTIYMKQLLVIKKENADLEKPANKLYPKKMFKKGLQLLSIFILLNSSSIFSQETKLENGKEYIDAIASWWVNPYPWTKTPCWPRRNSALNGPTFSAPISRHGQPASVSVWPNARPMVPTQPNKLSAPPKIAQAKGILVAGPSQQVKKPPVRQLPLLI